MAATEGADDAIVQCRQSETLGAHNALGTTATGAVRLSRSRAGMQVTLSEAAAQTPAGQSLQAADAISPAIVRPLIDHDDPRTVFADAGNVRTYRSAWVQVLLFKAAPTRAGWNPVLWWIPEDEDEDDDEDGPPVALPWWA